MVTQGGEPMLLDFGTAKLLLAAADSETTLTRFGAMTPRYASPEQLRGEAVSTSMNIYPVGVVLYELLGGRAEQRHTPKWVVGQVLLCR